MLSRAQSLAKARDVVSLGAITSWSPGIKPTWTIAEVRNALRQHADGDFSASAQLVDSFGEDDVIPGLYEKRVDAVLGSEFELQPVEAPNRQLSVRLADRFGPLWWDISPESETSEFLGWYRKLGVSVGTLDWERGGSSWTARLRTLHPQFLRRDNFRNRWIYHAQQGELEVTPGDGRWVLLVDGQRGWMRGDVRALAITWISKQLGLRDWNRFNERHGLPIIKAFAPALAEESDTLQFWDDVRGLHSETIAQLPSHLDSEGAKFDLDLLEAKDQAWQTFQALLERADRRFMVHILGSNLSTEVSGTGSLAATKVHRGVEQSKANADAQKLSTELRRQVLYPVIAYNVACSLDVVPWPKWDTAPPEDDEGNAKAAKTFGEALVQFSKAGYDVENLDEVAERYGVKLVKKPEPTRPLPTDGTPPAPSKDDPDAEPEAEASRRRQALQDARDADFDDSLYAAIEASQRAVIAGGPRVGKTTLAVRASERYGREARHSDGLMHDYDYDETAVEVAKWIDDGDNWIAEGVATARGLRQWLADNPGKQLDATIIYLAEARLPLSDGQASMATGVRTVWDEILPDLKSRGANIIDTQGDTAE